MDTKPKNGFGKMNESVENKTVKGWFGEPNPGLIIRWL